MIYANYFIFIGEYNVKGSALLASVIRATYSVLQFGRQYKGQILGDDQWTWLATTLQSSDAHVHIIISSIQVLTTNPVIESWGHFPYEKIRLFNLFKKMNPTNLLLLSGDVHMAEILYANYTYDDGSMGQWIEVTSSGLTHSCSDGLLNSFLCPLMNDVFSSHRYKKTSNNDNNNDNSLYMGKNFGYLDIQYVEDDIDHQNDDQNNVHDQNGDHDLESDHEYNNQSQHHDEGRHDYIDSHWILNVSIVSLEPSNQRKVMLSHLITINTTTNNNNSTISSHGNIHQKEIIDVTYGEFAHISPPSIIMLCYVLCLVVLIACLYINIQYIVTLRSKIHKLKMKRN